MNPALTWMLAIFWIARKPEREVRMATGIAGSPNGVEGLICPQPVQANVFSRCAGSSGLLKARSVLAQSSWAGLAATIAT
jgi:hypothetical protein